MELIVLRKMCRDDFLKRDNIAAAASTATTTTNATKKGGDGNKVVSPSAGAKKENASSSLLSDKKMPKLMTPPKPDLIAAPEKKTSSKDDAKELKSSNMKPSPSSSDNPTTNAPEHAHSRLALPKFTSLPPNPLAHIPRLFGMGHASQQQPKGMGHASQQQHKPQSFLSVSVLNLKNLHGGCDHCRIPMRMGGVWSSIIGRNNPHANTPSSPSSSDGRNGSPRHSYHHMNRRRKREHTIRPYIRFSLGNHEHCTKITKFNGGNPTWTKRHHNSCTLPNVPPDELRWFHARRGNADDLIVEVRNNWKLGSTPGGSSSGFYRSPNTGRHHTSGKGGMFSSSGGRSGTAATRSSEESSPSSSVNATTDPILASVHVPLSFINIEEDDNENENTLLDYSTKGKVQRSTTKRKNGASSTNITIPLRMRCCSHAPVGSISLKITIKVPTSSSSTENKSNDVPHTSLFGPNDIQVDISEENTNGEPKVNESIELGPLTRFMDGWSLGGTVSTTKDESTSASSQMRSNSPSKKSARNTTVNSRGKNSGNGSTERPSRRLRWSKQFDHQTKKWSTLKPNANGGGQSASAGTTVRPSPTSSNSSKKLQQSDQKQQISSIENDAGWFTFLNR